MNGKAKLVPLLLILVMGLGLLTVTPGTAANSYAPTVSSSNAPWIPDSSKYASYNGHISSRYSDEYNLVGNNTDAIAVAYLGVSTISASYSNLSVSVRGFFTGQAIPMVSGLWFKLATSTGNVADSNGHQAGLNGYPCFFFLPTATSLHLNNYAKISTPFFNTPLNFRVNKTETVLGIQTIQLTNSTSYSSGSVSGSVSAALWISNDSNGLMMRMEAHSSSSSSSPPYWSSSMDVSMQVFDTNILTLTLPPMPTSQAVPWMRTGRFIQYNLQGAGSLDLKLANETSNIVWQLPGSSLFRCTVSSNVTMRVERATTGYVDPWRSTRWIWVVHAMLNNTQILLPDFWRGVAYANTSTPLAGQITRAMATQLLSNIAQFNKTGLVTDSYFLVDNETGLIIAAGSPLPSYPPPAINPSDLGTSMQQGYEFLVLQYLAQSLLSPTWTFTNRTQLHQGPMRNNQYVLEYDDVDVNSSARVLGTDYLAFPGGGGGNCWKVGDSINATASIRQYYNATGTPSYILPPGDSAINASGALTSSGFIDIERFSGFPLEFQQHLTMDSFGRIHNGVALSYNITESFVLDLTARVPQSNIMWMSYETLHLVLGAHENGTYGGFNQYGFMITLNGANATDVEVTASASPPPDTGAPPNGTTSLLYISIKGTLLPGTNVITLYVFINRTKALALGLDEYSLRLHTWNATSMRWEELKDPTGHPASHYVYINATVGCIVGYLYHLSYFAVLGSPPTAGGGISAFFIIIAAAAVVVIVAVVVVVRKRKH